MARGGAPSVSHLLKESTQGIGSLWKESTQGVSSLLREISTATSVVPGFSPRVGGASDPLPVLPRSTSAGNALSHSYSTIAVRKIHDLLRLQPGMLEVGGGCSTPYWRGAVAAKQRFYSYFSKLFIFYCLIGAAIFMCCTK